MKKPQTKQTKGTTVQNPEMPMGRKNYVMILCGLGAIILGFILLSGGGSENPETEFNYEMFNFRRLYVAPLLLLAGFAFPIYGIMYRPKKSKNAVADDAINEASVKRK